MAITITLSAPDSALDALKEAWGGSTATETRAAIAAYLLPLLRRETIRRIENNTQSAENAKVIAALDAKRVTFDTNWPEG